MEGELAFNDSPDEENRSGALTGADLNGEVVSKIFTAEDGQFAIVRIRDHSDNFHVLLGPLASVCEGQEITAKGVWDQHKTFGRRFRVNAFKEILPTTEDGIRRYLASGVLPGVGPKLAGRIVEKFGRDTLQILDHYSSRLTEVPGLGRKKLDGIRNAWTTRSKRRDSYVFLQGLGISAAYCNRLFKRYGDDATDIVSENPYRLASDVKGIGFRMADAIAGRLNIAQDNPYRLGSGIIYVLRQLSERSGHTCYPESGLLEKAASILSVSPEIAALGLERAIADGAAIREQRHDTGGPVVYTATLHSAERRLAQLLRARIGDVAAAAGDPADLHDSDFANLNGDQRQAVTRAFEHTVSIITGGPGVGKTTATRQIVAAARHRGMKLALTAPTGRAAKRLGESSGHHAQTIHRLLKWDPERQHFVYTADHTLTADLVIVDEVSMLDIVLACSLVAALPEKAHIVLIGDKDQLPSIGPGNLLHDLIACDLFSVTHLTQVYRQSHNSRIITNAHRVNSGAMPALQHHGDDLADFYWIEQADPDAAISTICRMVRDRIPTRFKLSARADIQVLTPMNRGQCGTTNLNRALQAVINPGTSGPEIQTFGDTRIRENDRVMQITNNYDLNVFNGDLGVVHHIDEEAGTFQVQFDTGVATYGMDEADQIRLAYAATIHKAQGSEFPAVIIPVMMQHAVMLRRSLIYTAMTRAARLLIMIGSTKALSIAVSNYRVSPRYSCLASRLQAL